MKLHLWIMVLGALLAAPLKAAGEYWFASPTGSPLGVGSFQSPWDLKTALTSPFIAPGDTVFLRGGLYLNQTPIPAGQYYLYETKLSGEENNPIIVRSFPGEWARIDGQDSSSRPILLTRGQYTRYEQFEIMSSHPDRTTDVLGDAPPDITRGTGIQTLTGDGRGDSGPGLEYVHLVIHDARAGIITQKGGPGVLVYGCVIYYCGWAAPGEANGHAIYFRNYPDNGTKYAKDNIVFSQFAAGLHGYSSTDDPGHPWAENLWFEGNLSFNNGILTDGEGLRQKYATNVLLQHACSGCVATCPVVIDNLTWYAPLPLQQGGTNPACCRVGVGQNLILTGNYLVASGITVPGERIALHLESNQQGNPVITDNTLIGGTSGLTLDPNDGNLQFPPGTLPTQNHVVVRPSSYESGRAHIAVYKWDTATSSVHLSVDDLAGAIAPGDDYEIYDVQTTPLGAAVDDPGQALWAGTLGQSGITLDLNDVRTDDVISPIHETTDTVQTPPHTAPWFYAFVLIRPPDFDADGLPDRDDPNPIGTGGLVEGDFDGDGDVDLGDFAQFSLCFAGANVPPAISCAAGVDADFDNDFDVDLADFSVFSLAFTGPN